MTEEIEALSSLPAGSANSHSLSARDLVEEKEYEPSEKLLRSASITAKGAGLQGDIFKSLAQEAQAKRMLRESSGKSALLVDEALKSKNDGNKKSEAPQTDAPSSKDLSVKDKRAMFEKLSVETSLSPMQRSIEERKRLFEKPQLSPTRSLAYRLPGMTGMDVEQRYANKEEKSEEKTEEEKEAEPEQRRTIPVPRETVSLHKPNVGEVFVPQSVPVHSQPKVEQRTPRSMKVDTTTSILRNPSTPKNENKPLAVSFGGETTFPLKATGVASPRCAGQSPRETVVVPVTSQAQVQPLTSVQPCSPSRAVQATVQRQPVAPKPSSPSSNQPKLNPATPRQQRFFPEDSEPAPAASRPVSVKSMIANLEKTSNNDKKPSPNKPVSETIRKATPAAAPKAEKKSSAGESQSDLSQLLFTLPFERSKRGALFWVCTLWVLWCMVVAALRLRQPSRVPPYKVRF